MDCAVGLVEAHQSYKLSAPIKSDEATIADVPNNDDLMFIVWKSAQAMVERYR